MSGDRAYATGAAVMGEIGGFSYAAEAQEPPCARLSKPASWTDTSTLWDDPTVSARLGYRPDMRWNFGVSASTGTYLRPSAAPTVAPGYDLNDYREIVFGQDASFAWHYWQIWVEAYEARFEIPHVGDADVFSYYAEAKYKFTPQFFGAVRWGQQVYGTIEHEAGNWVKWGRDLWQLDLAPTYRFTPHLQLKLQYSLIHEEGTAHEFSHMLSAQFTARF